MSTAPALMAAVLARLRGDATLAAHLGDRVFDTAPRDAAFPHCVVEEITARDRSGLDAPLDELRLTLRVLSRSGGRREAFAVADRIADLLAPADLTLDAARLVLLRRDTTEVHLLKDRLTTEAVLRFVALAEPG